MLTMSPKDGIEKYLCDKGFETGTPISGTFELLPVCNMNCKMCYVRITKQEMNQQGTQMTAKEWLSLGKECAESGTMFLLLTGGEPLLHPEFCEIYTGLRKMGIIVTINTNGTLFTKEIVHVLRENMPRRVNVSLYGASNLVYEKLCQNPRGFDEVMEGIHLLLDAGIDVKLNYTLTLQNQSELDDIMRISDELNLPISIPTYIFPPERKKGISDTSQFQRLMPKEAAEKQLEILYKSFNQDTGYKENIRQILDGISKEYNAGKMENPPGGFLCSAGVSSFWVNWKGTLTPCGMMKDPAEDMREISFSCGWRKMQEDCKNIFTSTKCFNCRYRQICQSCAAASKAENGSYGGEAQYQCEFCEAYEELLKEHILKL